MDDNGNNSKTIASFNYSQSTFTAFTNLEGYARITFTESGISNINSFIGYNISYGSNKLEVKSTLSEVSGGTTISTAPAISSWAFNRSGSVNKITDVDGNREIFVFSDGLIIGQYYESAGAVTQAEQYTYNQNKSIATLKKAAVATLDKSSYDSYKFETGETQTMTYNADGSLKEISVMNVESDFISSYITSYTYKNYLVTSEKTTVTYKNSSSTKTFWKSYSYDANNRLYMKSEYEQSTLDSKGSQVEEYVYDSNGNLTLVVAYNSLDKTNQFKNEVSFDEYGRIKTVSDESGFITTYVYDGFSRNISEVKMPYNLSVKYGYDVANRLTDVSADTLKNTVSYQNNELTQLSDSTETENKLNFVYDNEHRLKNVLLGTSKLQSYEYVKSMSSNTVTKTNALNEKFKSVVQKNGKSAQLYYNGNLELESKYTQLVDSLHGTMARKLTVSDSVIRVFKSLHPSQNALFFVISTRK